MMPHKSLGLFPRNGADIIGAHVLVGFSLLQNDYPRKTNSVLIASSTTQNFVMAQQRWALRFRICCV